MSQRNMNPSANAGSANLARYDRFAVDRVGLSAEFQFGRDMATSQIDLTGGQAGVWTGAPAFPGPRLAHVGEADFLTIRALDHAELTIIIAAEIPGTPESGAALIGNYGAGDFFQFGYSPRAGLRALVPSAAAEGYDLGALGAFPFGVNVFAIRTSGAGAFTLKIDHFKGGDHIDGSVLAAPSARRVSGQPLRIGGPTPGSYFGGSANVHGAAIYSGRCMTDAELLAEVQAMTALAGATGPIARRCTRPTTHAVAL